MWCLKLGWVTLRANFRGKEDRPTQGILASETRLPVLTRGVVCVILRLAVLIQYRRVTDTHTHTQTDRQTHDDGYNNRASIASRG